MLGKQLGCVFLQLSTTVICELYVHNQGDIICFGCAEGGAEKSIKTVPPRDPFCSQMDAGAIMGQLPASIMGKYHWFNVPASAEPGHKLNPLSILLSETTPDDFVLFKIDIDNWQIEEAFVKQILKSPALSSRIDEMYWEHHVNFAPMKAIWGTVHEEYTMQDSLVLFSALRHKGIRIHSWV